MSVPFLHIEPVRGGLSRQFKATGTMIETEGGKPRIRKTVIGATSIFDLNFVCSSAAYLYFTSFYEEVLEEGNLPFKIDIISDGLGKARHVGIIVPGSLSAPRIFGDTHYFSFQFDGERETPLTSSFKNVMVALYPSMGDDLDRYTDVFNRLRYAVNVLAPKI